jgi:hypothetical protein
VGAGGFSISQRMTSTAEVMLEIIAKAKSFLRFLDTAFEQWNPVADKRKEKSKL